MITGFVSTSVMGILFQLPMIPFLPSWKRALLGGLTMPSYTEIWLIPGAILSLGEDLIFRLHCPDGYCINNVDPSQALDWIIEAS